MTAQNCAEWRPNKNQKKVLDAALATGTDRTITDVCSDAKVARRTFYYWMETDPCFADAWANNWRRAISHHLPGVVSAMLRRALRGDVQAARLVAQLAGVLVQRQDVTSGGEVIKGYVTVSPDDWDD